MREFPSGKVEGKESPEHCARRELLEETGLRASWLKPKGKKERRNRDVLTTVHYFAVSCFSGKIRLSREHELFRWFSRKEIASMRSVKVSDGPKGNYAGKIGTDVANFFLMEKEGKT